MWVLTRESEKEAGTRGNNREFSSATTRSPAILATETFCWLTPQQFSLRACSLPVFLEATSSSGLPVCFCFFIELCWWQGGGKVLKLSAHIIIPVPVPPRKLGRGRGELQVGTASFPQAIMRDGGLWSTPRYWAVFPHVFFFLVFKMYLFIYPFGLFWADSVSYLKVTRMEPFGQSPIFQLCQGQSVLLYLSIVENTRFKLSLLLFPLFLFLLFLYPLLLLRYSNHICLLFFFLLSLFAVSMRFSPCFSFPG